MGETFLVSQDRPFYPVGLKHMGRIWGVTFGILPGHMRSLDWAKKIHIARFWWKNRPAHSCSAGTTPIIGKNKHSLYNDKIVTKSCKPVIKSKFRPQRQQAAGPLYHTLCDLSSIIFSSFCTKKKCPPVEDTLSVIPKCRGLPCNWQQFPIHGRGRK